MNNMKTQYIILILSLVIFSFNSSAQKAGNIPDPFKAGEIVSADRLNEFFNATSPNLDSTIIGVWSTQCWDSLTTNPDEPGVGTITINSLNDIHFEDISCIGRTSSDNSTNFNNENIIKKFTPVGNSTLITTTSIQTNDEFEKINIRYILELTPNRIVITTNSPFSRFNQQDGIEILERINTPPSNPFDLIGISNAEGPINLSWKHIGDDENGFIILRRDQLTGPFVAIGETGINELNFTDNPNTGTHWYRVQSKNINGNSLGSNIIKVRN